jgi:hypothetical protein
MATDGSYYEQSHLEAHPSSKSCMPNPQGLKTPQQHEDTLLTFIYSYKQKTNQLHRTSLVSGEQSIHQVPSYNFKLGCYWTEVPGRGLLITGGLDENDNAVREVVRIDSGREFAVCHCAPMLTPRSCHAAVHHTQHLYVLGRYDGGIDLSSCERYVNTENRWEALPPLPRTCSNTSGVVVERNLYALGGHH